MLRSIPSVQQKELVDEARESSQESERSYKEGYHGSGEKRNERGNQSFTERITTEERQEPLQKEALSHECRYRILPNVDILSEGHTKQSTNSTCSLPLSHITCSAKSCASQYIFALQSLVSMQTSYSSPFSLLC